MPCAQRLDTSPVSKFNAYLVTDKVHRARAVVLASANVLLPVQSAVLRHPPRILSTTGSVRQTGNVPVFQCIVKTAAHQSTPVRGECHTLHAICVSPQRLQQSTGASVPDTYYLWELYLEYIQTNDYRTRTASSQPAATSRPLGLIAMVFTSASTLLVISRVFNNPPVISQILVVQSSDPEKTDPPSNEKVTEWTAAVWPWNVL